MPNYTEPSIIVLRRWERFNIILNPILLRLAFVVLQSLLHCLSIAVKTSLRRQYAYAVQGGADFSNSTVPDKNLVQVYIMTKFVDTVHKQTTRWTNRHRENKYKITHH